MSTRWIRSQRAAVAEVGPDLLLAGRDGTVRRLEGDSAELAREVLRRFAKPTDETELVAHIEALAGPLGERHQVVRDVVALLRDVGAIEEARDAAPPSGTNIVVAVSGAIAASHAPLLVQALQRRGHTVEVALTETAQRFVAVETLAAQLQREVHTSMWPRAAHIPVPHVALARWADMVVVYPASATTIARIARGDFSDLVAAIALTTRASVVIVPSMNIDMLESAAVQRNLDKLRDDGFTIVHGVPSHEVADAPSMRAAIGGAAPAAGEVAHLLESLRLAGVIQARGTWNEAYAKSLVPWASDICDGDIAVALAAHALPTTPKRLLDLGCGLGQVARHAADAGYRVVASDVSEVALAAARETAGGRDIVFVRDDICATSLIGPFDVVVDRATLHTLPGPRAQTYARALRKLAAPGATVIIKAHRDGVPGTTFGITAATIAALFPDFAIVDEREAQLPGLADATAIPSSLFVLRRR